MRHMKSCTSHIQGLLIGEALRCLACRAKFRAMKKGSIGFRKVQSSRYSEVRFRPLFSATCFLRPDFHSPRNML